MSLLLQLFLVMVLTLQPLPSALAGIAFNGDADYVGVGTMGNFGTGLDTNYFVASLWIKTALTTAFTPFGTFNTGTNTALSLTMNFDPNDNTAADGKITFLRREDGGGDQQKGIDSDMNFNDGGWHHLLIASNNTTMVMYFDCTSQTIATLTGANDNADNIANFGFEMVLGARNNRGTIDNLGAHSLSEVAMWSQSGAPTAQEVANLCNAKVKRMPLQINPASLGGYWPLDDRGDAATVNAQTFRDFSSAGNNGTGTDADGDSTGLAEAVLSYP